MCEVAVNCLPSIYPSNHPVTFTMSCQLNAKLNNSRGKIEVNGMIAWLMICFFFHFVLLFEINKKDHVNFLRGIVRCISEV